VVVGPGLASARLRPALTAVDPRIAIRFADLPARAAPAADARDAEVERRLAGARAQYVEGAFDRCLATLGDDAEVARLLGAGLRSLAARTLFWRIACRVGDGDARDAARLAERFAGLELEVPPDVARAADEVELVLARAAERVAAAPRVKAQIRADVARATVAIDGRPDVCATPCAVDLPAGEHVIRIDGDGVETEVRTVQLAAPRGEVAFATRAAPPELAATQWTARYAGGVGFDAPESMRLLGTALRARRLLFLGGIPFGDGSMALQGALLEPERDLVRAARRAARGRVSEDARDLARELLTRGGVLPAAPPVWKRPLFWIAVVGAAAIGVGTTAYLLHDPGTETEIVIGRPMPAAAGAP
jgi:hypothetical protein